jgi:CRISPR-associated protein Cas2
MDHFLVCYDISDRKRLLRIGRASRRYALGLQYSVYYLEGSIGDLDELLACLQPLMNPDEDDIRAYRLRSAEPLEQIGELLLPDGLAGLLVIERFVLP